MFNVNEICSEKEERTIRFKANVKVRKSWGMNPAQKAHSSKVAYRREKFDWRKGYD